MILVKLLSMEGTAFGDVIVMINDLLLAGVDTVSFFNELPMSSPGSSVSTNNFLGFRPLIPP